MLLRRCCSRKLVSSVRNVEILQCGKMYFFLHQMANAVTECFGDVIVRYLQSLKAAEGLEKRSEEAGSEMVQKRLRESADESVLSLEGSQCVSADQSHPLTLSHLRSLFLHHLLQLRCNAHSISAIMAEEECTSGSDGGSVVQTTSEVQLGSAVYPTASIMNHSCCPNAIFRLAAAVHHWETGSPSQPLGLRNEASYASV